MAFQSILFDGGAGLDEPCEQPEFFPDLNLDQLVDDLVSGREEYDLAPFFHQPLHDVEVVRYRHHVLRDLEREAVAQAVREFAQAMRQMREHLVLVDKLFYARQKQRWFLEAAAVYCDAVTSLDERLAGLELDSAGFVALREHVAGYRVSGGFTSLVGETRELRDELAAVRYGVHIKGNRVRVNRYDEEEDVSEDVERTFAQFRQGAVKDYRVNFRGSIEIDHVEAQILDLVARLHPETFAKLDAYCVEHEHYLDRTLGRFDREVQVYLAYLDYIEPLKSRALAFCYPRVSGRSKHEHAEDTFDLVLATKLSKQRQRVVCNDFHLADPERILVVSGPNNGGKTTFARLFGQLHYLASLGLPVPGRDIRLFLPDRIFTHFEREEDIETLRGKFEDELFRIREILRQATAESVLVMNESFGSTTLHDALLVGTAVMQRIIDLDAVCVFVTFVDELASVSDTTVSMMSTVAPDDPAVRTFQVVRKPADGLAYAGAIAAKYGLTYERLRRRVAG